MLKNIGEENLATMEMTNFINRFCWLISIRLKIFFSYIENLYLRFGERIHFEPLVGCLIYDYVTHSHFSGRMWLVMVELSPRSAGMLHGTPLSMSSPWSLHTFNIINKIDQFFFYIDHYLDNFFTWLLSNFVSLLIWWLNTFGVNWFQWVLQLNKISSFVQFNDDRRRIGFNTIWKFRYIKLNVITLPIILSSKIKDANLLTEILVTNDTKSMKWKSENYTIIISKNEERKKKYYIRISAIRFKHYNQIISF